MKRTKILLAGALLGLSVASFSAIAAINLKKPVETEGYTASSLPTTIDLNDSSTSDIRSYYSSLNELSTSERQGTNLLKNLKTILKNGQKYYSYESGENIWKMYEITDRDWEKSPASAISGYNSSTNKITGYSYNSSDPYVRAIYVNRNVTNQTTAWSDHQQTQWGINREHLWPKAEGFDSSGAGGARGDPFHLVAANGYANNIHSNYYYGFVDTSSSYTDCGSKYSNLSGNLRGKSKTVGGSNNVFEPQDSDKGDIARSIFYMVARYNYLSGSDSDGINTNNPNLTLTQNLSDWASSGYTSSTSTQGKLGILTDLLRWHKMDPVDEIEIHRNNLLYKNFTNNRNPFIDFPEWADYIWGTASYTGTTYNSYSSTPTGYAKPSSDTVNGYNSGETTVEFYTNPSSVSLNVSDSPASVSVVATGGSGTPSWTSNNTSVVTVSGTTSLTVTPVGEGTTTITGSYSGLSCTINVTVSSSGGSGGSGDADTLTITRSSFSSVGGYGTADAWSATTSESSETITGYADIFTNNNSMQFNGSNSNSLKTGIFNTVALPNNILSIAVNFNSSTASNRTMKVYVGSSPLYSYSDSTLTDNTSSGTELGSVSTSTTSYSATGSNKYFALGPSSGAVYIDSIVVTMAGEEDTIVLNKNSLSLTTGSSETLQATATGTVTWASDAPSIASVNSSGLVTANSEGTAYITATCGTASAICEVTVADAATLSYITISDQKTSFTQNTAFSFGGTVTAHYSDETTEDVTASATFSGYNMSTLGEQTVTVSYGDKTTSYTITISASGGGGSTPAGTFTVNLKDKSLKNATSYQTSSTTNDYDGGDATASLAWGSINPNSGQLRGSKKTQSNLQSDENFWIHNTDALPGVVTSITITGLTNDASNYTTASKAYAMTSSSVISSQSTSDSTAGSAGSNNSITWTFDEGTSGKYFAIGCIQGFTAGSVYAESFEISYAASSGGSSTPTINSVTITPNSSEVYLGADKQLTAIVSGENNPDKSLTWTSSNTSVATISSSGLVTPKSAGTTTITATSVLDNTKSGTATITVKSASLTNGSPYMNGVPYKMFYNKGTSTNYYFNGSMSGYYGATNATISNGIDVCFEANGAGQNIYMYKDSVKYYISIVQSGSFYNFNCEATSAPSTPWIYDSTNGCLTYSINSTAYSIGGTSSGTYTTIGAYTVANTTYKIDFVTSDTSGYYGFATVFMNSITCDATGKTAPVFANGVTWSTFESVYAKLSEDSQNTLKNASNNESGTLVEQAMHRYDYMLGKYTSAGYTNFIERSISSLSRPGISIFGNVSSSSSTAIIILVVVIGVTSLGLVITLRKRKEN